MNEISNARWLRWCLTGILFFLAVIALELSVLTRPIVAEAEAEPPVAGPSLPDSAMQRQDLLAAQRETNNRLDAILQHLRTQTIKVQVAGTDKDSGRPTTRKARPVQPRKAP